jgi:hypothetical protein
MGCCPLRATTADHVRTGRGRPWAHCTDGRRGAGHQVFLTHGHLDHVGAVATHAGLRRLHGRPPATYHAHADLAPLLQTVLHASEAMSGVSLHATVRPFQAGGASQCATRARMLAHLLCGWALVWPEEIVLEDGVTVQPLPSHHRVPSYAVAVWRTTHRLKPELQGLSGDEIALRRQVRALCPVDREGAWLTPGAHDGVRACSEARRLWCR